MIASDSEAIKEYARNAGADHPERAWILTPWDVWERNPFYQGPPQRHPEAYDDDYGLPGGRTTRLPVTYGRRVDQDEEDDRHSHAGHGPNESAADDDIPF